jgi:hypothetical protein
MDDRPQVQVYCGSVSTHHAHEWIDEFNNFDAAWCIGRGDDALRQPSGDPLVVPEELRRRPEDQPLPIPNDHESIHDMVARDIEKRKRLGLKRYGSLLQPFNGRDNLQDAYEEALDLVVYLRTEIEERRINAERASGSQGQEEDHSASD